MSPLGHFRSLTRSQRHVFVACFLGWSLDAFDFFILTFCVSAIAATFRVSLARVLLTLPVTLMMRPLGAFVFGWMAEKYGRRPTLMINVISFSVFELASAFAPSFAILLVTRALFGFAMGGEWGVGAALTFESLPERGRGFFSGLLQEGYVTGNFLAGAVYAFVYPHLHGTGYFAPWRVVFMLGALPALLTLYMRTTVEESPAWEAGRGARVAAHNKKKEFRLAEILTYLPAFLFLVALMTAFISFSHGTQDIYPTFLQKGHGFSPAITGKITMVANFGALLGGICIGSLSEKIGRRRAIIIAALLAIPMIPLWAWTHTPLMCALGGFLMQFCVQGAWGVVPVHLNELSPPPVRATFPGLAYQLGNVLSSWNVKLQEGIAVRYFGGTLNVVLSATVVIVALTLSLLTLIGRENHSADLSSVT